MGHDMKAILLVAGLASGALMMGSGALMVAADAQENAAPRRPIVVKSLFAVVNKNGTLARGTARVKSKRNGVGLYGVSFPGNISKCAFLATIGGSSTVAEQGGTVKVNLSNVSPKAVAVQTGSNGALADRGFHLLVAC